MDALCFRFLERIGQGSLTADSEMIDLPESMVCNTEREVLEWAFFNNGQIRPFNEIKNTSILAPHNDVCLELNERVIVKNFHYRFRSWHAFLEKSEAFSMHLEAR